MTFAIPAVEVAGEVATTDVSLELAVIVAGMPPKLTPETPVNPVPVIVTLVPPAVEPVAGEIDVIVGAEGAGAALVVKLMTAPGVHVPSTLDHAAK